MEFEHLLRQGLLQKIAEIFNIPTPLLISTNDRYRLGDYLKRQNPGEKINRLTYPILFIKLNSAAINTETYNPRVLNRHPRYGSINTSENVVKAHKMIPVKFEYELIHITQQFTDMMKFTQTCLLQAIRKELNFTMLYDGNSIAIRIVLAETVGVPEKDANVDLINVYETTTQMTVHGYITDSLDEVKDQSLIRELDVILETQSYNGNTVETVVLDEFIVPIPSSE